MARPSLSAGKSELVPLDQQRAGASWRLLQTIVAVQGVWLSAPTDSDSVASCLVCLLYQVEMEDWRLLLVQEGHAAGDAHYQIGAPLPG